MAYEGKWICADKYYGKDISKTINKEKKCYSEGLYDFIDRMELEEKKKKEC